MESLRPPHIFVPPAVQVGWADSATPAKAHTLSPTSGKTPGLPLGTTVDKTGTSHTTRVFATYDLSGLEGTKAYTGTLIVRDTDPAHCAGRDIEVWRTAAVSTTPKWNKLPAEQTKLAEVQAAGPCPGPYIDVDVSSAITDAVAAKQRQITFELRVPAAEENDTAAARTLDGEYGVQLNTTYNHPPQIDNATLTTDGRPCSQLKPYPSAATVELQARATDPDDGEELTTSYAVWPVGNPDAKVTYTGESRSTGWFVTEKLPAGSLTDGQAYVWQAQASDGTDTSPWSKKCYFTYDATAPSTPTIVSSNYPENGNAPAGVPATFTFSGHGDKDIAGFRYGWGDLGVSACSFGDYNQLTCPDPISGPGVVGASQPGGKATVVINPRRGGPDTLVVRSIDKAGRVSANVSYQTFMPNALPTVQLASGTPVWGQQVTLKLAPAAGLTGVTGFNVTVSGDDPVDVQADQDGTAYYTFWASALGGPNVQVRSISDNGFVSPAAQWQYYFSPGPGVLSDVYPDIDDSRTGTGGVGVAGAFTFTPPPGVTDVTAYQYQFDSDNGDVRTVSADADGTAHITWTPTTAGFTILTVSAVEADGSVNPESNDYFFEVPGDS